MAKIWQPQAKFRWLRTVSPPKDDGCHADSWPEGPREYLVLQQAWLDIHTGEVEWHSLEVVENN